MTTLRWGAATDVGRARERNEDSYFAGDYVFAVADGLGGHRAGEVASHIAVEEMSKLDHDAGANAARRLEETVEHANAAVYERARTDPATSGMATTVTAVAIDGSVARLAHVGDSRCYLLRDGTLQQVSRDHTLVHRLVEEGTLTPEQAETHPQRSVVTRALGSEPSIAVDVDDIDLRAGDRLLLCSDGLSSVVPEPKIAAVLEDEPDPQDASAALIEEANRLGGPDNITVVLLDVVEADAAAPTPRAAAAEPATPVRRSEPAAAKQAAQRRVPMRALVWTGVVVVVLAGGLFGVKAWANRSWYVGVDGQHVAVFQGLPTDFIVSLHHVHHDTGIALADVEPYYADRLRAGIRAKDLDDANAIAARARPAASPTSSPSASPSPSGAHS